MQPAEWTSTTPPTSRGRGFTQGQLAMIPAETGSIVTLDRLAGEPVDLLVNGRPIARGEVVVIDEEFGLRITDVLGGVTAAGTSSDASAEASAEPAAEAPGTV